MKVTKWNSRECMVTRAIEERDKRINRLTKENRELRCRLEDLREYAKLYTEDPMMCELVKLVKKPGVRAYINSLM